VWAVVFGLLAAASLFAADEPLKTKHAKEPKGDSSLVKKKLAKAPAKKPHSHAAREMPVNGNVVAIEEALAGPIQLDFNKAPLQDVIDYLKTTKNIEVQLDKRVLEDAGVSGDMRVTINVKGISLKSALCLMLRNMQPELSYMVTDEVLLITTPDVVDEHHVTRVYPVGDLVVRHDEHGAPWDDYDPLIDLITSTNRPTTWDGGPPGSISGKTLGTATILVVTQTDEMHERIADLLAKLREIAKNSPNAEPPYGNQPRSYPIGEAPLSKMTVAIKTALASATQLDFTQAPLQDVIDHLKAVHKIEIQLDKRVLEDVGVSGNTQVKVNVKGTSLKAALRLMLGDMQPELTYMIKDEVLLITTPDLAEEVLPTRLYPVGDLVACRDEHDAPWDDYDSLIDLIKSTVRPTRLITDCTPGSIAGITLGTAKILTVTQTEEIHEQIADLLAKLRGIAKNSPNAGTPRRNRPVPDAPHGNKPVPAPTGNSGTVPAGIAPKPAEKPTDAVTPPERKQSAPVPGGVKPS
jgi:hypothetical protein